MENLKQRKSKEINPMLYIFQETTMRAIWYVLLFITTTSCSEGNDNYFKTTGRVHIIEALLPDTSKVFEAIQIQATAEETNGCWRDIYFALDKKSEFVYGLKAIGTFETYGTCPTNMVSQDTLIEFLPTQKGTYFFHIDQKRENKVKIDSVLVQ